MESQPADQGSTWRAGPYLLVAVTCEAISYHEDGSFSIDRVMNGIGQSVPHPDDPSKMHPVHKKFALAIVVAAGDQRGTGEVAVTLARPSGPRQILGASQVNLVDDYTIKPLQFDVDFTADEPGVYSFEIYFNAALATSVPFRVAYEPSFRTG